MARAIMCDRCGERVTPPTYYYVKLGVSSFDAIEKEREKTVDVCRDCFDDTEAILKGVGK